jgi:hypothetical protein
VSARDELADDLQQYALTHDRDGSKTWADYADAILAAGYSKPRTITTLEELDALGLGATVLDVLGDVWTNDGDDEDQWGSVTAKEDFGGPQWYGSSDILLAVTVLHEGATK